MSTFKKKYSKKILFTYGLIGIIFGLCFPIGALFFESYSHKLPLSISSILELHKKTPLLYMIDTAPFFLGIFALVGGFSRAKAEQINDEMSEVLKKMADTNQKNEKLLQRLEEELATNDVIREGSKFP